MCVHGDTIDIRVPVPARCSHTGEFRWAVKPVDRCLARLVVALNAAGALTSGACCGHGKGPGSILLHDRTEIHVPQKEDSDQLDGEGDVVDGDVDRGVAGQPKRKVTQAHSSSQD